jgi:hypothetical protein
MSPTTRAMVLATIRHPALVTEDGQALPLDERTAMALCSVLATPLTGVLARQLTDELAAAEQLGRVQGLDEAERTVSEQAMLRGRDRDQSGLRALRMAADHLREQANHARAGAK